jgi:SAM-dependent methyltransferase
MGLKKPLPPGRNFDQVRNHYLVEKAIAERLKKADRGERSLIYSTMYDELFSQVPDHPRLTQRNDGRLTRIVNLSKFAVVDEFLDKSTVFAEFAPGDCRFAEDVARYVKYVYAIDISDQRGQTGNVAENFRLVIYDGYRLEIEENSVDVVFSDQLIEHLHPTDTKMHFELVYRILKPGGKYIFRTPHAYTGPHDVSGYFSDSPEGFHLKEWTFIELKPLLKDLKYSRSYAFRRVKGIKFKLPYYFCEMCEEALKMFPKQYKRVFARYLVPEICIVAIK